MTDYTSTKPRGNAPPRGDLRGPSATVVAIAPGVAISLAVLGWNLLGDGLRDALDPRLTE